MERDEAEQKTGGGEDVRRPVGQLAALELDAGREGADCGQPGREHEQRLRRPAVAGRVEAVAVPDERNEQRERDERLLEVEPLREMRCGGRDDDGDCELPRATAPVRERARKPDQGKPERERADAGGGDLVRRQYAPDEVEAIAELGCERRDDADHSDGRRGPREQRFRSRSAQPHAARVQRVHAA